MTETSLFLPTTAYLPYCLVYCLQSGCLEFWDSEILELELSFHNGQLFVLSRGMTSRVKAGNGNFEVDLAIAKLHLLSIW
jgi:hypothetical protein